MKKITELTETKWRTVHRKDAYGNRERDTEEYTAKRPVKSITSGLRFVHYLIDRFIFGIFVAILSQLSLLLLNSNFVYSSNLLFFILLFICIIVIFLLLPALYTLCEYKWQKTPGKFLSMSLVIDEYGNKPNLRAIILRSIIRLVPFEELSCIGDKYSYGWHDKWTNTWVVTKKELETIKKLQIEQSESNLND